jgi:hypothetical protein
MVLIKIKANQKGGLFVARGFGTFWLVILGCFIGLLIEGWTGLEPVGVLTLIFGIATAAWVIVYYQKKNKEEMEAELSQLKDKLDKTQ